MRLGAFENGGPASTAFSDLASDRELVRDIQGQLTVAGLLDPKPDGNLGPVTQWALSAFSTKIGTKAEPRFTRETARRLLRDDAADLFSIDSGSDLSSKIVRAMQRRGYWIARHPDCYTIVYVEGMDPDGKPNDDTPNQFNDARLMLQVGGAGKPVIAGAWIATTTASRFWTEHPMNSKGAARIALGQYKSWIVGTHHPGTKGAHEALIQAEDVTVYRDLKKDYGREGPRYTGLFAINQHWGYDLPRHDLGRSSAGCLVGEMKDGHRDFMKRAKSDPRFLASRAYRFMSAILPVSALEEEAFDPATPH